MRSKQADPYLQNLAVKALVLREIQNLGSTTVGKLFIKVDELGKFASARDSTYDFVYWAGATIGDILSTFVARNFVTQYSDEFQTRPEYQITERGEQFLQIASKEVGDLMLLFEPVEKTS